MCRSTSEGGRRCEDHRRLSRLQLADLVPDRIAGVPEADWGSSPLTPQQTYETYDRPIAGAAVALLEQMRQEEPRMTADVLESLPPGARAHGLEYRVKSPQSLARKVWTKVRNSRGRESAHQVSGSLTDVVRYTGVARTPDEVVPTAQSTLEQMRSRGWTVVEAEHSYVEDNPYKGLHTLLRDGDTGITVELQFHSEQSQDVKDANHADYELARDLTQPVEARDAADERMRQAWAHVDQPAGLESLHTLGECPVEPKHYPRREREERGGQRT